MLSKFVLDIIVFAVVIFFGCLKHPKGSVTKNVNSHQHYGMTRSKETNGGGGRCHNLKNGKEATEDTEESPAGCAEEGKWSISIYIYRNELCMQYVYINYQHRRIHDASYSQVVYHFFHTKLCFVKLQLNQNFQTELYCNYEREN